MDLHTSGRAEFGTSTTAIRKRMDRLLPILKMLNYPSRINALFPIEEAIQA
jgi:hypothetical protein